MRQYYTFINKDPFKVIPLTFHIQNGTLDPEWAKFSEYYDSIEGTKVETEAANKSASKNIWIIKPGETTNRGNGI